MQAQDVGLPDEGPPHDDSGSEDLTRGEPLPGAVPQVETEMREVSFEDFVVARWPRLLRTAYLLTGDHDRAEDLVQNALVRAHRHWPKLARAGSPEAYVRKIMVNLNTDWWRRLGSREHAGGISPGVDRPAGADAYEAVVVRDELWTALRSLPAKMRATLVLRYFEDLSEAETAHILNCSIGSVKSQCSRGLARLQQAMTTSAEPRAAAAVNLHPSQTPVRSAQ